MVFIEVSYNILTFKRTVKMYKYFNEILKHNLLIVGLRPSIQQVGALDHSATPTFLASQVN